MTAITLVSGRTVDATRPEDSIFVPYIALENVTMGYAGVVQSGGVGILDAGTDTECDGLFMQTTLSGQPVDMIQWGPVAGFDLSGQSIGDLVYADVDDGSLKDVQEAGDILVGKVTPSQVESSGKVLWVNCIPAHAGQDVDVDQRALNMRVTLGTSDNQFIVVPWEGTLTKVWSVVDGTLDTGDETLTLEDHDGDALTAGVITIAYSGSAAGDIDSCTPTANNVFAAGEKIEVIVGGENGQAVTAVLTFLFTIA